MPPGPAEYGEGERPTHSQAIFYSTNDGDLRRLAHDVSEVRDSGSCIFFIIAFVQSHMIISTKVEHRCISGRVVCSEVSRSVASTVSFKIISVSAR